VSSASVEVLDAALRERGLRATPQRRLVLTAIAELGHTTPEQIHDRVHAQNPSVNLSTVYRALDLLESLGLISHTHLDHGAPTYHLASHARHLHLVCGGCGAVIEAELSLARPLAALIEERHGFVTDLAHLSVHGICAGCHDAGLTSRPIPHDHSGHDHSSHDHREVNPAAGR
jgi:Fur family transcriptional regulator, ferric uptake regulator